MGNIETSELEKTGTKLDLAMWQEEMQLDFAINYSINMGMLSRLLKN